jgi:hypothetical protein
MMCWKGERKNSKEVVDAIDTNTHKITEILLHRLRNRVPDTAMNHKEIEEVEGRLLILGSRIKALSAKDCFYKNVQ